MRIGEMMPVEPPRRKCSHVVRGPGSSPAVSIGMQWPPNTGPG